MKRDVPRQTLGRVVGSQVSIPVEPIDRLAPPASTQDIWQASISTIGNN